MPLKLEEARSDESAKQLRARFLERLEELRPIHFATLQELARFHGPTKERFHWATRRDLEDRLVRLEQQVRLEQSQALAAIERIDQQTYGICTICGDCIADARLGKLPYTQVCRGCSEELEALRSRPPQLRPTG